MHHDKDNHNRAIASSSDTYTLFFPKQQKPFFGISYLRERKKESFSAHLDHSIISGRILFPFKANTGQWIRVEEEVF